MLKQEKVKHRFALLVSCIVTVGKISVAKLALKQIHLLLQIIGSQIEELPLM